MTPVFNGSASLRNAAGQMIEEVAKSTRRNQTIDDAYMDEQNDIRTYVKKGASGTTALQTEFVVWPLYK